MWPMGCTDDTLLVALFIPPAAPVQHCDVVESGLEAGCLLGCSLHRTYGGLVTCVTDHQE